MASRFFMSFMFLPASLRILRKRFLRSMTQQAKVHRGMDAFRNRATRLIMDRIVPHPRALVILLVVLAVPAVISSSRIELSNDLLSFLDPESELVRKIDEVAEKLAGTKVIYLTLYGSPDDFRTPGWLTRISSRGLSSP